MNHPFRMSDDHETNHPGTALSRVVSALRATRRTARRWTARTPSSGCWLRGHHSDDVPLPADGTATPPLSPGDAPNRLEVGRSRPVEEPDGLLAAGDAGRRDLVQVGAAEGRGHSRRLAVTA